MLCMLVTERRGITGYTDAQPISTLTTTFWELGALQQPTGLLSHPKWHALASVATVGGKTAGATAAMEVATTAGATITATETHHHTGETTMITTTIKEIEVVYADCHGVVEDETRGICPLHSKPT